VVQDVINLYGYEGDKRVLKRVVERENLTQLCRNQFGNYVIQHILKLNQHWNPKWQQRVHEDGATCWQHCPAQYRKDQCLGIKAQVIEVVFENVDPLGYDQFGSNVVERCLHRATSQQMDVLLDKLLLVKQDRNGQWCLLQKLCDDRFGNYVVQRIIEKTAKEWSLFLKLENGLRQFAPRGQGGNYRKHVWNTVHGVKYPRYR